MKNPWEEINLSDYENHMSLDSVKQLQAMNEIMKLQFDEADAEIAMVLGIAGGNGLEHVDQEKYKKVYGIDINAEYLKAVQERYKDKLDGVLECVRIDLINESDKLPKADLVIANLLIEYIGYEVFKKAIMKIDPKHVSCVIQINTDTKTWVSDSPYLHAFDRLDEVHHQMAADSLEENMIQIGYRKIGQQAYPLPNGKSLVRMDFII